jgi:hypothetical protein
MIWAAIRRHKVRSRVVIPRLRAAGFQAMIGDLAPGVIVEGLVGPVGIIDSLDTFIWITDIFCHVARFVLAAANIIRI